MGGVNSAAKADVLAGLTAEQQEAVLHTDGPLLILAGAGSGKTRVVTRRIARLVHDGVAPGAVLAITFTNKAAGEMRERVGHLLPHLEHGRKAAELGKCPTVSTFHSLAVRILRKHAERAGWSRDFAILDEDDQVALVREAAVAAHVDVEKHKPHKLVHGISRAKEELDDAGLATAATTELERAVAATLPFYRELQRRRGAMDFDDLVATVVQLLDAHADIRAELEERFEHVLVDEYQDTNHAQYRLARHLAGSRRNLCVCGDPDQSIYGWRGADLGNILNFEQDYPGAKVVRLEKNYRSTPEILRGANAVIANNTERKEKQLLPAQGAGGPIEVRRLMDGELEAAYVARRIEELIAEGKGPGEIAILIRAGTQSRPYEEALLTRNVPCTLAGATSFYDRAEVKDAMAFVRLAANPNDDLAALRALRAVKTGIGKTTIDKVHELQRRDGVSIVEACARAEGLAVTKGTREALLRFAGLSRDLARTASGSVGDLVKTAVDRSGLGEQLKRSGEDGLKKLDNLEILEAAAREADRKAAKKGAGGGARDFLDRLSLREGRQEKDDGAAEEVVISTIHSAKGLEWPVVFCVGMEEGLFPHQRALAEGHVEEERRLAYVAFTRARERLVLTYANLRAARNPADERRRASRFVYELPADLLWDPERKTIHELPERQPDPVPGAPRVRNHEAEQDDELTAAPRRPSRPLHAGGLIGKGGVVRPAPVATTAPKLSVGLVRPGETRERVTPPRGIPRPAPTKTALPRGGPAAPAAEAGEQLPLWNRGLARRAPV
jgi:DNA helicase-2/ATP-dependent DNA helicase PcrA